MWAARGYGCCSRGSIRASTRPPTGYHFARPGNRFWPALHRAGFTERQLHPSEQFTLLEAGLGITNVVARATARADELSPAELLEGGAILAALAARWRPTFLAVLGVTAYRAAFARPKAVLGRQPEPLGGVPVWVLPNPSGLNAHYTVDSLAAAYAELRAAAQPFGGQKVVSAPPSTGTDRPVK